MPVRGAFSGPDRCRGTRSLSDTTLSRTNKRIPRCPNRPPGGLPTNPVNWIFPPRVLPAPSRSAVAIKHEHKRKWLEEGAAVRFALSLRVGLSLGDSGLLASTSAAGRMVAVLCPNQNINPVTAAQTLGSRFWTSGTVKVTQLLSAPQYALGEPDEACTGAHIYIYIYIRILINTP